MFTILELSLNIWRYCFQSKNCHANKTIQPEMLYSTTFTFPTYVGTEKYIWRAKDGQEWR